MGRPKRIWKEVVREDCRARMLNKEDAVDHCKWRKVIKEVRWPGWVWAGECFFWYRLTRVVPDKRPLNGCCCCCKVVWPTLRSNLHTKCRSRLLIKLKFTKNSNMGLLSHISKILLGSMKCLQWWGAGVVIFLERGADLMLIWCHCHSVSLASVKSRLVLPFWYQLTWVVPDKWPLNGCVCMCHETTVIKQNKLAPCLSDTW